MHVHWHTERHNTGLHSYRECRCGHREVVSIGASGHQPVDRDWLEGAAWDRPQQPPPNPRFETRPR